ncbi:MAG: serine/threonine protein kinase [Planctomycetes bacterium]|nr:serine/threonine protein kinase [Planctomycetota bacterium]
MSQHGEPVAPDFGHRSEFYTFAPQTLEKVLADFELVREVGKGSMGIVYEARRRSDAERVAIKVLPPSLTLTERALARFLREAELMRKVEHRGIARVHEHGRQDRLSYFVMDFVEGVNLDERLRIGPLPVRQAADVALQAARALHFAHERGIVHRDVKPANLILREDGSVVITDFGLARETGTGSMTESGAIVGTPMYMAPEQVLGERAEVGARSDVYGLGATLYTLLAGRPPYDGPTAQSVLKQVLDSAPPRLRRHRAEVPRALEAIVFQAMERRPELRYGSCAELADDLERFLADGHVLARMPGPAGRAWRRAAERPLLTTLVVLSVALAVGAAALWSERRQQRLQAELAGAERLLAEASGGRDELGRTLPAEERQQLLFQAVAAASQVIVRDSGFARAWFVRAKARHLLREHRAAIADLDAAERAYGSATPDLLLWRIDALSRLGDAESRKALRRDLFALLDVDPGRHSRCIVAGHLLDIAQAQAFEERREVLDSVARIVSPLPPDGAHEMVIRARLAELRGELGSAVETIRAAIDRFPGDLVVQTAAAVMFQRLGFDAEGELAAARARMIDPAFAPAGTTEEPSDIDVGEMEGFLQSLESLMHNLDGERR